MNRDQFLLELMKLDGEECIRIITNEDEYTIEDGACFIGGTEGAYMSELLGNIYYDTIKEIGNAIYNYITEKLKENIVEVDI